MKKFFLALMTIAIVTLGNFSAEAAAVGGQGTTQAVGVVDPASFGVLANLGKSRRTCLVESKYLAGTSVSKI